MWLFLILCAVPIMFVLALVGWALMFAEVLIALILLVIAALVLPFLSQWLLGKTGRRLPIIPIAAVILVLEVVFLWKTFTSPVDIELPTRETVAAIHVQDIDYYNSPWEVVTREVVLPDIQRETLLDSLYDTPYKIDLRFKWPWQESIKQEHDYIYKVELQDKDGEVLSTIHIYDNLTVRPLNKRGKEVKYRATEEQPFDYAAILDAFKIQNREAVAARWQNYIDALLGSITYTDAPGELSFTIPETRPNGTFYLLLTAKGMVAYDPDGEYVPIELHTFVEEQKSQNWEAGKIYTLSLNDSIFEYNRMELHLEGEQFVFDLLPYMDARYTYKK